MAEASFKTLQDIFRMVSPGGFDGKIRAQLGGLDPNDIGEHDAMVRISKLLLGTQDSGLVSVKDLPRAFEELLTGTSDEDKRLFHRIIRFYNSDDKPIKPESIDWYRLASTTDQPAGKKVTFSQIVNIAQDSLTKPMGIILSNAPMISPAVRRTGTAELFLNTVPSHVLSRCVPYLNVELVLDRELLSSVGQMRFLMGGGNKTDREREPSKVDMLMINSDMISEDQVATDASHPAHVLHKAGMEMFTSPQTLVDPNPLWNKNRYAPVLDPFRPLASIEGCTITAHGTFGLLSYRKAQLQLKLHDRSRLAEFADFIKPRTYTKTTVWLTYGWVHPNEPDNPYAALINNNMLVREAYGVTNAEFSFDEVGQVSVNLQLFTKGCRELQDVSLSDLSGNIKGGVMSVRTEERKIEAIAERIKALRVHLGLDKPSGLSKEIRGSQLLEAGSLGSFSNLDPKEVSKQLTQLEKAFKQKGKIDNEAAKNLIANLKELYSTTTTNKKQVFVFKEQLEKVADKAAGEFMKSLYTTPDPFLIFTDKKLDNGVTQLGDQDLSRQYPFVKDIDADVAPRKAHEAEKKRKYTTAGKILSTAFAQSVNDLDNIDELQLVFYPMNERAGAAAGLNIAEFPIDTGFFQTQVAEYIAQNKGRRLMLVDFLRILLNEQLRDVRAKGYGFADFFKPYDPKAQAPALKEKMEEKYENTRVGVESGKGPFKMPIVELYIETSFASTQKELQSMPLARKFEIMSTRTFKDLGADYGESRGFTRIMRVHVFDKTVEPYALPTAVFRSDDNDESSARVIYAESKTKEAAKLSHAKKEAGSDVDAALFIGDLKGFGVSIDLASMTPDQIKERLSQMLPRLAYGSNATGVKNATVSSVNDALISTIQARGSMGAGKASVMQPDGSGVGGLPLRVLPANISMTCFGCPLLDFAQLWFIDFATGTTIDNIYNVTQVTHTIGPGNFETQLTMTYADAYGRYENPSSRREYLASLAPPEEKKKK